MAGQRALTGGSHPDVSDLLIAGRDVDRAQQVANRSGGRAVHIEDAFSNAPDVAIVATATAAHPELIRQAISHGVPILCEKPISESLPESRELVSAAEQTGIPVHVGFQRRFDPGMRAVRRAVTEGTLGRLYHLRIAAHDAEPGDEHYIASSGSMFRDMHVHDFDLVRWLTGEEVVEVDAVGTVRGHERYARHGDVDVTALRLTTDSGLPVLVTGSRHNPAGYEVRLEALGSGASLGAGNATAVAPKPLDPGAEHHSHPRFEGFLDRFATAFELETHAFLDALARGDAPPTPAEASLAALQVAVAAERSWQDGTRALVADREA
ncbi:dehydrogenase [Egibacter rhizosphaerae]|uniref:Dehydrogenase n=2 Tax=Egibacter rhizosphaerae TaxID=1670831 RepID=A0A411YI37_9ACTN|nr:dehydrogenase [Egibacter rhizosphaerae]